MSTRESTNDSDIWIHSPITQGGIDRMRLAEEGLGFELADMRNESLVRSTCEVFWGYPAGSLDGYVVEETTRSTLDRFHAQEFLIRDPATVKVVVELLASPERVDYKEYGVPR